VCIVGLHHQGQWSLLDPCTGLKITALPDPVLLRPGLARFIKIQAQPGPAQSVQCSRACYLEMLLSRQLLLAICQVSGKLIFQQDSAPVYGSGVNISQGSIETCLRCGGMFFAERGSERILKITQRSVTEIC